jgi:hypothetical protein
MASTTPRHRATQTLPSRRSTLAREHPRSLLPATTVSSRPLRSLTAPVYVVIDGVALSSPLPTTVPHRTLAISPSTPRTTEVHVGGLSAPPPDRRRSRRRSVTPHQDARPTTRPPGSLSLSTSDGGSS